MSRGRISSSTGQQCSGSNEVSNMGILYYPITSIGRKKEQ